MTADAARHPDLLTAKEVAALLGHKPDRGWGPPPLPQYRRPRYYSREMCEQWLAEQKEAACRSTVTQGLVFGGVDSGSRAPKSGGPLARQIAAELRSKSEDYVPTTRARHLIAVSAQAKA